MALGSHQNIFDLMQATEKCQNCGKDFPESKINSHFSYCRRNIKKCQQCGEMVDINYMEQHNADFHTKQACKYCKKQLTPQELTKHEGVCPSKPKYCEYCDNNIAVNEFDKHVNSCGSRTKLCQLCEKNILLRDYDVHSVTCTGKSVSPPPIAESVPRTFQKRPSEGRRDAPQVPSYGFPKPDPYAYRAQRQPEVPPTNVRRADPVIPSNPARIVSNNPTSSTRTTSNNPPSSNGIARIDSRGKQVKKQTKPDERKPIFPQNDRYVQPTATSQQRVVGSRQEPQRQEPPRPEPPRQQVPRQDRARRQQPQSHPLYEEQKQYLREAEKQRQKPQQSPIYEPKPASYNPPPEFEVPNEDQQMQKAIYESMGLNKMGSEMKGLNLGVDAMSQSFYRDIQLQQEIEKNLRAQKQQPRRR